MLHWNTEHVFFIRPKKSRNEGEDSTWNKTTTASTTSSSSFSSLFRSAKDGSGEKKGGRGKWHYSSSSFLGQLLPPLMHTYKRGKGVIFWGGLGANAQWCRRKNKNYDGHLPSYHHHVGQKRNMGSQRPKVASGAMENIGDKSKKIGCENLSYARSGKKGFFHPS